jgi:hypothetical protein
MGNMYTIRLEESDLGQLLDGLRSRSESWHNTSEYFASGFAPRDDFVVEECNGADEALGIAGHYDRIIASIESQVNTQRTLP